jgi:hypothetical protein
MSNRFLLTRLKVSIASAVIFLMLFLFSAPLSAQYPSPQEPRPENPKQAWFSIGPVLRGGMNVKVTGSSYAKTLGMDGLGSPNTYDDRTYDNGYVRRDSSGGGGIEPNTTWNWGYNDPAQYDAVAGTLSFQRQGVPRYRALTDGGGGREDDMLGAGLQAALGLALKQSARWTANLVVGFQGIWGESKLRENAAYVTVTDVYNVAGIAPFPAAGHRGAYAGPFDPAATPPYTVINNLPSQRTETPFAATGVPSSIAFHVDQGLYQISLGPQIGYAASSRLRLHVIPKISLNVWDMQVERTETFQFGDGTGRTSWRDTADKLKAAFGLSGVAGADLDLGKGWFTGIFGGYEWVPDKTKINVGPNTVSLDASGWVAGLSVGKNF